MYPVTCNVMVNRPEQLCVNIVRLRRKNASIFYVFYNVNEFYFGSF